MISKTARFLCLTFLLLPGSLVLAAAADISSADSFSAKAFLEEIMMKRYAQSLATFVNKDSFTVAAQIETVDAPKKVEPPKPNEPVVETPFDLLVGTLDSEKLIKQYGLEAEKPALVSFLSTKKIKSVFISVGLKEELGETVKMEVDKWLKDRMKKEMGTIGKNEVNLVKAIPPSAVAPKKDDPAAPGAAKDPAAKKEWWDWLEKFQNFAGVVFFGLVMLLGIMFWRVTTSKTNLNKSSAGSGEPQQIKLSTEGTGLGGGAGGPAAGGGAAGADGAKPEGESALDDERKIVADSFSWNQKINAVAPKITSHMENLVRNWNNEGGEGRLKIVCFADVVGKEVGRLPIPQDAISDIAKVFAQMADVDAKKRNEVLEKVYWDLVTVLNLGPEVLVQPFSYLAAADPNMLSEILMDQNPKLKTLVSHYLPDEVRKKFINPLTPEQKLELLNSAVKLKDISSLELGAADKEVKSHFGGDAAAGSIVLDMTFEKIVATLTRIEEIQLLNQMTGDEILVFKRRTPSVAFFHEWPDDKLGMTLGKLRTEQILTYLRVKPEFEERFLALCPPMTREVLGDDLRQEDRVSAGDKEKHLNALADVLVEMVRQKEIDLEVIFTAPPKGPPGDVVNIRSA